MQPATAVNKFVYLNSKVARSAARACRCPVRVCFKCVAPATARPVATVCKMKNAGPIRCMGVALLADDEAARRRGTWHTCPRLRSEQRAMFA